MYLMTISPQTKSQISWVYSFFMDVEQSMATQICLMGPDGNPTVGIGSNAFSYLGAGFRLGSAEIYSIFILFDI